jgi:tRNA-intron endonuclease
VSALEHINPAAEANAGIESKINALMKEDGVLVSSPEDVEELSRRGYGVSKNGQLMLTFYEALFLLGKRVIEIKDARTKKSVTFQTLLQNFKSIDENAWVRYLIYRDLRSRGYVAREGFGLGIDFRIYERGGYRQETAKYLVFGVQEGKPVSIKQLAQSLRYVQSLKKKLVLAVINRRGEVVYYSISQLTFE